ncbi:MAG TPA: UDP-N-acetylglucosamine 2-epimerase, partial [Candidatus Limnocylindrales bacterium]
PERARAMVGMLHGLAEVLPVVLPLHPRGRPALEALGLGPDERLRIVEPLPYLEFLGLVRDAALVVTDSGGIQEETTFMGVPCLTVRPNTERPVTISHGTNRLVDPEAVPAAARSIVEHGFERPAEGPPLWDGHAGERIAEVVAAALQ